nr:hypothetical protein GCM10025699_14710 [Microbacterium flavescens]
MPVSDRLCSSGTTSSYRRTRAYGWLALRITPDSGDWTLLAELLDTSYRQVALQRQLRALDAR